MRECDGEETRPVQNDHCLSRSAYPARSRRTRFAGPIERHFSQSRVGVESSGGAVVAPIVYTYILYVTRPQKTNRIVYTNDTCVYAYPSSCLLPTMIARVPIIQTDVIIIFIK